MSPAEPGFCVGFISCVKHSVNEASYCGECLRIRSLRWILNDGSVVAATINN